MLFLIPNIENKTLKYIHNLTILDMLSTKSHNYVALVELMKVTAINNINTVERFVGTALPVTVQKIKQ